MVKKKAGTPCYYIPVNTRDITGTGCSMPQCAKVHTHTCTHNTHFGNTVGFPIPVANPTNPKFILTQISWNGLMVINQLVKLANSLMLIRILFKMLCLTMLLQNPKRINSSFKPHRETITRTSLTLTPMRMNS